MYIKKLKCLNCSKEYVPTSFSYKCSQCGGILEIQYDRSRVIKSGFREKMLNCKCIPNIWYFKELLPIENEKNIITLEEGNTPIIRSKIFIQEKNKPRIDFKDESRNPTCSFKDRPLSVAVSKVKEDGKSWIITSTHGNAGIALAAYAAKAGLNSLVIVPDKSPEDPIAVIQAYGTRVYKIKGDISDAYNFSLEISNEFDIVNLSTTFLSPYTTEGDKTIAFEIFCQYNGILPDWVLFPIGDGPILVGCYKGFKELVDLGLINKIPRLVAVQSEKCAPIAKAYIDNVDEVESWDKDEETIATGINEPLKGYPEDGSLTLKRIRESGGLAITVNDDEIVKAMLELIREEGLFPEPTASVGYAGAKKLYVQNYFKEEDKILVLLTGGGMTDIYTHKKLQAKPKLINKDLAEFKKIWEEEINR